MIRLATPADLRRLIEIRDNAGDDPLSDPGAVTDAAAAGFINGGALWVWQEGDRPIAGFAAIDAAAGAIWALLVAPGHEGKGIGRALLKTACEALREAGHQEAVLTTSPGTRAERHYRAAGWTDGGADDIEGLILRKPL